MPTTLPQLIPGLPWGATGSDSLNPVAPQGSSRPGATSEQQERLQAAMEVEAIFLRQLLEQMRRAMVDTLGPSHQNGRGYLNLADQHLARSLASGGGLGLAAKILEELSLPESQPQKENRHEGNLPVPGQTDGPGGDLPISKAP